MLRLSGVGINVPVFSGRGVLMKAFFSSPFGKRALLLAVCLFAVSGMVFAQDDPFGISTRLQVLLDVIGSPWVKGIAAIALIVECIMLITSGRQEPGMFKKFVPWIAGTILFMAASTITSSFINPEDSGIKNILDE
jgi:type IV secretory pathway VirB2 component (pilin)